MMRRSKKPWAAGIESTSMRGVRSMCESMRVDTVDATACLAETLAPPRECRRIQAITVVLSEWSIRKRSTLMPWKWRGRVLVRHPSCDGRFPATDPIGPVSVVEVRSKYIRRRPVLHPQNASHANEVLAV